MVASAADVPPEFAAAGVVRGDRTVQILVPGAGMSVYGRHLGPVTGCAGVADPKQRETANPRAPAPGFADLSVYPRELCGVQVLIGGKPAGLLYVSEKQINFKVPQDSPESGTADLRIVYQGQSSVSLAMKAGFEKTSVSLDQPAYTNMPVWLRVELPFEFTALIQYPFVLGPAGFGCNEIEVRRNGRPLPLVPGSDWMRYGMVFSGFVCGSYLPVPKMATTGRLPLHLLYRFDIPGTYEVRFTLRRSPFGESTPGEIRARSEWTPIEVLPSAPNQRADWLNALRAHIPSGVVELLSDVLPSVLGLPDQVSLEIAIQCLYHENSSVRRYAMNGLSYWPEDSTSRRLLALLHTKGPSDELVRFLMRQPDLRSAHSAEIAETSLPFLESDSAVAIDGAITALGQAGVDNSTIRDIALRSVERIVSREDVQNRGSLLQIMARTKDERVHRLLRKLVEADHDLAVSDFVSFGDPGDLPTLGTILKAPGPGGGERFAYLPELLYKTYGKAAVPYLRTALPDAPGRFTQRNIAIQLMAAGDAAGFQFALDALERETVLRTEMMQALRSQFPELKGSDEDTIKAFLKARSGN